MTMWCVCDAASGDALGVYFAGEPTKALDALAQDRGYPNFEAWVAARSVNEARFAVCDANEALHVRHRALHGSNYGGWSWYDESNQDVQHYDVPPDVCSPPFRTIEAAAFAALQ